MLIGQASRGAAEHAEGVRRRTWRPAEPGMDACVTREEKNHAPQSTRVVLVSACHAGISAAYGGARSGTFPSANLLMAPFLRESNLGESLRDLRASA